MNGNNSLEYMKLSYSYQLININCNITLYSFLLQILSAFVGIPTIHVLRLHDIYPDEKFTDYSTLGSEEISKKLNIKCLSIKFVATCGETYYCEGMVLEVRLIALLMKIVSSLPNISSLILLSLPIVQCKTTYLHDLVVKIAHVTPVLKRLFIRDTVVSIDDASRILKSVQNLKCNGNCDDKCEDDTGIDGSYQIQLRRRKSKVERNAIETRTHTEIFELVFIDVFSCCIKGAGSSVLTDHNGLEAVVCTASCTETTDRYTTKGTASVAGTLPESRDKFLHRLKKLTQQVYDCPLDRFCYSGDQVYSLEWEQNRMDDNYCHRKYSRATENPLQTMIFPTRDLRMHLNLLDLNDKVYTLKSKNVLVRYIEILLHSFVEKKWSK